MSEIAVTGCREGLVIASESREVTGERAYRDDAQKIVQLGPRLACGTVGCAELWDLRRPFAMRTVGDYLAELTSNYTSEADPRLVAERLGRFYVAVVHHLAQGLLGGLGAPEVLADWEVGYVVAGYARGSAVGRVCVWGVAMGRAQQEDEWTTDDPRPVAIGVWDEWPEMMSKPTATATLRCCVEAAAQVIDLAVEEEPDVCGGKIQVATITPERGFAWLAGREPPPRGDWQVFGQ